MGHCWLTAECIISVWLLLDWFHQWWPEFLRIYYFVISCELVVIFLYTLAPPLLDFMLIYHIPRSPSAFCQLITSQWLSSIVTTNHQLLSLVLSCLHPCWWFFDNKIKKGFYSWNRFCPLRRKTKLKWISRWNYLKVFLACHISTYTEDNQLLHYLLKRSTHLPVCEQRRSVQFWNKKEGSQQQTSYTFVKVMKDPSTQYQMISHTRLSKDCSWKQIHLRNFLKRQKVCLNSGMRQCLHRRPPREGRKISDFQCGMMVSDRDLDDGHQQDHSLFISLQLACTATRKRWIHNRIIM